MKKGKDRLRRVVIVGATPAGIAAANKLGETGIPVTLVDRDTDLDEKLSRDEWTLPSGVRLNYAHRPGLIRILRNPGIRVIMPADVTSIKHSPQGFSVRIARRPTYINEENCVLCGRCAEVCAVTDADGRKAVRFNGRGSLPGRPVIEKRNEPLCQANCPLGVNVQGYMALTKEGKYRDALELIRERNVLPSVCGRVCTHPCESACRRGEWDDPLAIREIKRFVADHASDDAPDGPSPAAGPLDAAAAGWRVAVIGSGPAGLTAAAELARHGCAVTVYEKEKEAGGLLRYAVGDYRLPPEALRRDIGYIENLGVAIETGRPVRPEKDLASLLKKHDAVIAATGAWRDRR
ncbi:MAG TPA: FAD-dependent oxidoreductase, partial [Spirochaetes bacterium]|nr:FAD-dependent oxidoreductase [Spirochaetota bacterium]